MYKSFFHLKRKPFDLLPNPDFIYPSTSFKKARTVLEYAIQERAGFILLTGEIGSGKTTLIRDLIKKHKGNVVISKIFNTRVSAEQLIAMINDDFGLSSASSDKIVLLRDLNQFLIDQFGRGNMPVLFIDEAQNFTAETLDEVRMLSNLETDNVKLLQIILVGQPELRNTLASPGLIQLRQRISVNCHIKPLSHEEVQHYILHRLEIAGNRDALHFSEEALELIWVSSRGIPRLINIICDYLMLAAFAEGTSEISGELASGVLSDLNFESQYWDVTESSCEHGDADLRNVRVSTHVKDVHDNEMKLLISDIVQRLELLENRGEPISRSDIDALRSRIALHEDSVRDQFNRTAQELSELKRDLMANKISADTVASSSAEKSGTKKGLLRKLFSAG